LQNFSFQLPTYKGSVLEAFRRTKHACCETNRVLQQALKTNGNFQNYRFLSGRHTLRSQLRRRGKVHDRLYAFAYANLLHTAGTMSYGGMANKKMYTPELTGRILPKMHET
jgi:hypothetical protein